MSCLYCWNQPKRFGKYDLYIDGKITANEIIYKSLTESGKNENINLDEIIKSIEERLSTHFTFNDEYETYNNLQTAFEEGSLKETVIYIVKNENDSDNPDSRDKYNEYMIVTDKDGNKSLELIGSGSFTKQQSDLALEINARTTGDETLDKKIEDETSRATDAEKVLTDNLTQEVTDRTNGDNVLDEKIDSTKSELQKEIDDDVNVEKERAEGVESSLQIEIGKRVVKNDPITITEGDNTTSITSDAISTTTLSGTLDAESMKNSLTAEAIQNVAPIKWTHTTHRDMIANAVDAIALGNGAKAYGGWDIAIGANATTTEGIYAIAIGGGSSAKGNYATSIQGRTIGSYSINFGGFTKKDRAITLGYSFIETTDNGDVSHDCTTEGTGSITIGAGANTKNTTKTVDGVETTIESSNSITIGCKAENKGADSVVIGASATNAQPGSVVIGVGNQGLFHRNVLIGFDVKNDSSGGWGVDSIGIGSDISMYGNQAIAIGRNAGTTANYTIAIGESARAERTRSVAIGFSTKASADYSTTVGAGAKAADYGATVIRSTAEDGTYTQLYFSGQNTPLALKYYPTEWEKKQDVDEQGNPKVDDEGNPIMVDDKDKPTKGQAMMGYVVSKVITNEEGNQETKVLECGTNLLAALFPNHGLGDNPFQPTTTAIDGEIVSFHPSDLDMPIEETPIEEEYKPLPIYPIVESTIE